MRGWNMLCVDGICQISKYIRGQIRHGGRRIVSGAEPPESGSGREAAGVWVLVSGARGSRSEAWERQRACDGAFPGRSPVDSPAGVN